MLLEDLAKAEQHSKDARKLEVKDVVMRGEMFMLNMSKYKRGKRKGQYKYIEMKGLGEFNTHGKTD